jgi:SulP family sulfate permease
VSSLVRNLAAGSIVAVVAIASAFSNAALLFSGDLAYGLNRGVAAALITASVCALIVALTSGYAFAIAGPDTNATTVLAVASSVLAQQLSSVMAPGAVLIHILVALSLSALLTGVLLYGLGRAQVGSAIRYIPYPLIGGFLAATGWLMISGAVRVVTDVTPQWTNLASLVVSGRFAQLASAVAFAALLAIALWRVRHFLTLPSVLVLVVGGVHLFLVASNSTLAAARDHGWFFETQINGAATTTWALASLSEIDWSALLAGSGALVGVMVVTTITMLLNATGLEVATGTDVDLNRELRSQGFANVASATAGGFIGALSLTRSVVNHRAGASSRAAGVVVALICAAVLFAGSAVVGYVPKFVLGGLLLYIGGSLFFEWGVLSWRRLSPVDYLMVLGILVITVRWGFINAVLVGLVAGCIIFAINYSRVRFVKHEFSGQEFRSTVERPKEERVWLGAHGDRIRVLLLQGYLFFGSANRLYTRIKEEFAHGPREGRRFLILDFHLVHGIDSSAIVSFTKIARASEIAGAELLLTGLGPVLDKELRGAGLLDPMTHIHTFPDVDRAMEWSESQALESRVATPEERSAMSEWREWLIGEMGGAAVAERLAGYMERVERVAGEYICRQGEASDAIFFVEQGRVSILLERPGKQPIRLRSMTGRTVIGEVGFYLGGERSASVVADDESIVHRLTSEGFERIEREHPELASRLNSMIVRVLAERLIFANGLIDALQR